MIEDRKNELKNEEFEQVAGGFPSEPPATTRTEGGYASPTSPDADLLPDSPDTNPETRLVKSGQSPEAS